MTDAPGVLARTRRFWRAYLRDYSIYVVAVPITIFIADDILTGWHDHGHQSRLHIILENGAEDITFLCLWLAYRGQDLWERRPIPHWHCECPRCHFKWVMHPKHRVRACPQCGAAEPI